LAIGVTEALARFASLRKLAGMPVDEAREINDREAVVMFGPVEPVDSVEEVVISGGLRARIYRPVAGEVLPMLVYFHGGGWVVGSLDSHDGVARYLANHSRSLVISAAYRLAPENRFPAAVEDAWSSLIWAHEHAPDIGGDAARAAVGGDSSGGNLAAVMSLRARDRGIPLRLQLLIYPALDQRPGGVDEESAWWLRQYLRTDADGLDREASPLLVEDLHGLAPALILSCELDPLRHQADAYATRLRAAGVAADHVCFDGLIHGAYRMPAILDGAREMLVLSAAALKRSFHG
jgi:acetyl esterase